MPNICFSYSADLPLGAGNRNATQQTLRDARLCFSYSDDMPPGIRNRSASQPAPHDLPGTPGEHPGLPTTTICFSYVATNCFRY